MGKDKLKEIILCQGGKDELEEITGEKYEYIIVLKLCLYCMEYNF